MVAQSGESAAPWNMIEGKPSVAADYRLTLNQITTNSLSLTEAAQVYALAGVTGLTPWRDKVEALGVAQARRILADHGLAVTGFCIAGLFTQKGREGVAAQIDASRAAVDMAAELGSPSIVTVVGGLLPGSRDLGEARKVAFDAAAELLPHARSAGVTLAIEALHPMYVPDWSVVSTLGDANDWCDRLGEGTGVAVDSYHVWWDPNAPAQIARAGAAGRLTAFHISDWLPETRHLLLDRGIPGEGVIDNAAFLRAMNAAGFTGWTEVEIFSERLWAEPPEEVVARIIAGCEASLNP
jgi:sugar phosphate isomerase/epimerase